MATACDHLCRRSSSVSSSWLLLEEAPLRRRRQPSPSPRPFPSPRRREWRRRLRRRLRGDGGAGRSRGDVRLALAGVLAATGVGASASSCWSGPFESLRADCCDFARHGAGGNPSCWDGDFSAERCCSEAESAGADVDVNFLEDAIEAGSASNVHEEVLSVNRGRMDQLRVHRGDYVANPLVRFDFPAQRRGRRGPPDEVRIFVHDVPACAGRDVLERYRVATSAPTNDTWAAFVRQQVQHLAALDDAMRRSGALVGDPAEASLFYVPAFWSLLIEDSIRIHGAFAEAVQRRRDDGPAGGRQSDGALAAAGRELMAEAETTGVECISRTFEQLRGNPYYLRNAAYDHFWVAGIQHPFNPIPRPACQIESYDPFAKNMMVFASGVRDYGYADRLFEWSGPLYTGLQRIFVPYSTPVHCRLLEALARSARPRPLAFAFVGSATSRVRHWTLELSLEEEFAQERRAVLRFGHVGQIQAASRGENGEWSDAGNATRLYQQADFCLVLPGHLHDMTKRCYDAMAQGCLPVVVTKHRFWMALPFAAQVPWPDFANFRRIRSKDDLRKILRSLLARHEQDQKGIRQRRLALARNVGLFAVHDEAGCTPEERAAFPRYLLGELEARQRVWPHIASSWEFEE